MGGRDSGTKYGAPWSREELILTFDLYCRIPFKTTTAKNPAVRELAALLGRTPAAVARKLDNFGAFDPELRKRNISGLSHVGRLDREVWDEFHGDWGGSVVEAHTLRQSLVNRARTRVSTLPSGPSETTRPAKHRLHQAFFRDAVLSNFECRCCITGVSIAECLVASHIIPWSRDARGRADPANGLCLSATFDRLFDTGLITVAEDLTVRVALALRGRANEPDKKLIAHAITARQSCVLIASCPAQAVWRGTQRMSFSGNHRVRKHDDMKGLEDGPQIVRPRRAGGRVSNAGRGGHHERRCPGR